MVLVLPEAHRSDDSLGPLRNSSGRSESSWIVGGQYEDRDGIEGSGLDGQGDSRPDQSGQEGNTPAGLRDLPGRIAHLQHYAWDYFSPDQLPTCSWISDQA